MTNLTRTVVNNAILDPLQGFDTDVFVLDQSTGGQIMVGRFASFQWTVRNATEPYMEFNQRIPRLLDGEFQFGWVLEQGLIDVKIMENIFGFYHLGREMRPDRSPRLQITVEFNAPALSAGGGALGSDRTARDTGELLLPETTTASNSLSATTRTTTGRYHLQSCKTDSVTLGAMAGRSVVAVRLEGLCEGYYYEDLGKSTVNTSGFLAGTGSNNLILDDSPLTLNNSRSLGQVQERTFDDWSGFFSAQTSV